MAFMWFDLFFNFQPFPKQQILDASKLQEFSEDKFEIYENGKKFSIRV